MLEKYKLSDLNGALSETLNVLNAPDVLPKLGILINKLRDIIHIIERYSNANEFYRELLSNIDELSKERLARHNIYPIEGVYKYSPYYYLLVSIETNLWTPALQLCSAIFFSQLINDSHEKDGITNLSLSNQNLLRQLLTSQKNINRYSFNIFSVYSVLDGGNNFELFTNTHLSELINIFEKIFNKNSTSSMFISSIKAFESGTLRQTPPRIRKKKENYPQQIEKNKYVKRSRLNPSGGVLANHELLEVETGSECSINSTAELAKYSRTKLALRNHYPQIHNLVLNDLEATVLYHFLLNEFIEDKESVARFSVLLMLLLGLDLSWLKYVVIVGDFPEIIEPFHIYINKNGLYKFNVLSFEDGYKAEVEQENWLDGTHTNILTLGLPEQLLSHIELHEYANLASSSNIHNVNTLFDKIRYHLGRRFTQNKIREFLFNRYYRVTSDEVTACFLLAIDNYASPTGCYYTSLPLSTALTYHQLACQPIFGVLIENKEITNNLYIGSNLNVNILMLDNWLPKLVESVNYFKGNTRTLSDLVNYHNVYVKYVATVILITTGHRIVNDLFDDRNFFFIEERVLFIGDKASSKENSLRVIPLCSIAIEQLTSYVSHVNSLAFRLSKFNLLLAKRITFTATVQSNHFSPFLFEISDTNELIGLKGSTLEKFWGKEFTLPANFNRHLLSTYLSKPDLSREYINYFLGHLAAGQSPFSHTSTLNIVTALQPVSKCLDLLCQELNLKVLKGLKKGKSHEYVELSEFRPKKNIVGSLLRQKIRHNQESKINKKVKEYFDKEYPNTLSRNVFMPLSKGDIEKIKTFLEALPKYQVGKSFEITRKIITRFYRKFNKKPPIIWFVEKNEASGLLPLGVTFQLQQAKKIMVVLESLIVKSFIASTITFTDKLALSYMYALSDNLNHKTDIKDYLTLIQKGVALSNQAVYLTNRVESGISNWFPNTKQLLLISYLKHNWPSVSPTQRNLENSINKLLNVVTKDTDLKVLTLTQYISFFRYSYIFKRSPAEYKQQNGEGLYTLNRKSLASAKFKEDLKFNETNVDLIVGGVFAEVSTSIESLNLIDDLKPLRNSIRNNKRLEQRTEFKRVLEKYITSSDEFAYVLAHWGVYMLNHGTRKKDSPAISTLITYLSVNTHTFNNLLSGKSILEMHDFECSCLIEEVLEINGTGKHQLSAILNFIDFLEIAANKKNILIEAAFIDIEHVDVNYFSDDEIQKLRQAQWSEEDRLYIEILIQIGCRPSEAYSRLVSDIDTTGECLQFRTNILSKLKNEFSIRPFPFSKLTEDLVQSLIKVKNAYEGNRPIFDVSEQSNDQVNYKAFCYSLNLKIKSILKRNVSIKHFRHSFSRKQFIANPNSSLRCIWQDSSLMGHSSPATSQKNYSHDVFQENRHVPISDTLLSSIGLIKEATIRKIRSRKFKKKDTEIANSRIFLNSQINKLMN